MAQTMARYSNLVAGYAFSSWLREREGAAGDALPTFPDLSEDCAEACSQRVSIPPEGQAEVGEGGDGSGG